MTQINQPTVLGTADPFGGLEYAGCAALRGGLSARSHRSASVNRWSGRGHGVVLSVPADDMARVAGMPRIGDAPSLATQKNSVDTTVEIAFDDAHSFRGRHRWRPV